MGLYSGSCLCGSVAFELEGSFAKFFFCHCSRCRKTSGSAHCANLFAPDASLTWTKGEDHVTFYHLPETRFARTFCRTCGSMMPTDAKSRGLVVVPAGCLDSDVDVQPDAHLCCDSRANWDEGLEGVTKLPGMPS
ncbi:Glutathione-dependent formaldehyde-activating enzyme [Marinomonas aquimarina]|uniref:Glutathione-dependent formaldehyde-activating enzyme n=1 Tax=Marinomonas aquimarina TaxID=295068 RepID=A0A1A8TQ16_9GAMM|nr:GFA family protein [Marinomonas aquimarina]SBS35177.1 Glutathione-dependent formaldehyde-activating enzyme [Marinomonas aquimarina]